MKVKEESDAWVLAGVADGVGVSTVEVTTGMDTVAVFDSGVVVEIIAVEVRGSVLIGGVQAVRGETVMIKKRINIIRRALFAFPIFVCTNHLPLKFIVSSRYCGL